MDERGAPRTDDAPRGERRWPLVTVVVLAHNRREQLALTLRKLAGELDYPADALEIIVVDNASTDGTPEMVRSEFPEALLLTNGANVGVAAWNKGFERGRGDYFLALDDDCYMTGSSLRRAVAMAEACQADLVSFVARSTLEPGHVFNDDYNTGLLAFWGCAALLSRRAVETLGGFDPDIFAWAHETEFTMRLLDRGLRHLFVPDITAEHMVAPAARLTPFFYRTNIRNLAYIAAKLLRGRDAAPALANLLTMAVLRAVSDPRMAGCVRGVAEGAWAGMRRRSPVRPRVSSL
jgi:GT2 family glycosyltransferase